MDPSSRGGVAQSGESIVEIQGNNSTTADEGTIAGDAEASLRFYVAAPSVSAVRRALFRAPGGARVMGRCDRETVECAHTMDGRSFARHWPVLLSRLDKAGLRVVTRPSGWGAGAQ